MKNCMAEEQSQLSLKYCEKQGKTSVKFKLLPQKIRQYLTAPAFIPVRQLSVNLNENKTTEIEAHKER